MLYCTSRVISNLSLRIKESFNVFNRISVLKHNYRTVRLLASPCCTHVVSSSVKPDTLLCVRHLNSFSNTSLTYLLPPFAGRNIQQIRFYPRKSTKIRKEQKLREKQRHEREQQWQSDDDSDNEDENAVQTESPLMSNIDSTPGYKDQTLNVTSLRLDNVVSSGLNIGRLAVEDAFYNEKLTVNGEMYKKKSKQVKEGDTIEIFLSRTDNTKTVARIIVIKIHKGFTSNSNYTIDVRRWKGGIEMKL